jgi:protein-arginine deiminase
VAALSAAEANAAKAVLVADPDDLPTALSKLPPSLAAAVKDAADAVESELVAKGSIDAARPSMFSSARTAILAKGAPVSGLADDLADAAEQNVNFLVNRTTTYDSNGNLECTPPCKSKAGKEFPWGRIYFGPGAGAELFDSATKAFLQAQIVQKPFPADTNWLLVGHVDEMVSFVPAPGPKYKNWCFLIASPKRAFQLLDSVPAATVVMDGRQLKQGNWGSVTTTAGALRNGTAPTPVKTAGGVAMTGKQLRKFNLDKLQKRLDKVRETFEKEAGVEASRTIHVPVIFKPGDAGLAEALTADMVNMLVVNNTCVIPKAFGPVHPGPASDLFYDDLVAQLNAKAPGLTLKPVDDWYTYHAVMGEIHCGTNVNRHPSSLSAWLGSEAAEWWRFKK